MDDDHAAPDAFHGGELALQAQAGMRARLEATGAKFIRDHMPDQHREFFAKLPTLFVGSLDAQRRPWASMLYGPPGFVSSPDARHLAIAALPLEGDPLREALKLEAPVGLLGIEPATRRRNRMNGTVVELTPRGFSVEVDQSFGNCPQYIQARAPRRAERAGPRAPVRQGGRLLAGAQIDLVRAADTLFIATASANARGHGGAEGVDVSHRGGKPGFVRVHEDAGASVLTVPDFRGNFFFNTLGNIAVCPRAGLLFVDYTSGNLLQITGSAAVVLDDAALQAYAGALRLIRVMVEETRWFERAVPLQWSEPEFASQLSETGNWAT